MRKNIYLLVTAVAFLSFHYQTLAQQTGKTRIIREISIPHIDIPPYIVEYESIPKDSNTYFTAEYNTGIIQDATAIHLEDTIKKYVDIAVSEIKEMYGADAVIGLRSDTSTTEDGEMLISIRGFPVKWANFKSFADYFGEKSRSKPKKEIGQIGLGVDLGVGAIIKKEVYGDFDEQIYSYPVFTLGLRYMYVINSYFDADFIKLNFICPFYAIQNVKKMSLQLMAGIRGKTPAFFKTMSGYATARLGYGVLFMDNFKSGFALETEVGLNIIPSLFIAFAYNLNCIFVYKEADADAWGANKYQYAAIDPYNTCALRIGFNF